MSIRIFRSSNGSNTGESYDQYSLSELNSVVRDLTGKRSRATQDPKLRNHYTQEIEKIFLVIDQKRAEQSGKSS